MHDKKRNKKANHRKKRHLFVKFTKKKLFKKIKKFQKKLLLNNKIIKNINKLVLVRSKKNIQIFLNQNIYKKNVSNENEKLAKKSKRNSK